MFFKLNRIIHTFTFRLGLVYVGLFGLSAIVLFGFIYTFAMNYLQSQINDSIRQQHNHLLREYQEGGSYGAENGIEEFIVNDDDGTAIYLLVNKNYEKMAGNLNEWPVNAIVDEAFGKGGHWARFYIEGAHDLSGIEVRAVMVPLAEWGYLLVGRTLQNITRIEQTIIQTFWASLVLTLAMAFFGAVVMTRSVMRRINVINRSAKTIMGGYFSVRIPFTPGGDEFDDLSSNLNRMLDRIEALLQSLSDFANNIAHDLRSPLNRIINRLDAGVRNIDRANPAYDLLEKNLHDAQELVATFNAILKISELEADAEFRELEPCDLRNILDNLVDLYEPYAAEKHITLTYETAIPAKVRGERHLLTQAFANLIDNAIKFTPAGGKITISQALDNDYADVIIADNGPGVPEAFRAKVFEKFFRLEESRHTKGNGLGLSLVAAIARLHGATITLEDNAPGLRAIVRLPLA